MRFHPLLLLPLVLCCMGVKCSAMVFASPARRAATAMPGEPGVVLKQRCGNVDKFTVRATAAAVRVDIDTGDFYLISQAPVWQVYIIRPGSKEMTVVSHQDWCHKYLLHRLSWTGDLKEPTSIVKSLVNGRRTIVYRYGSTAMLDPTLPMRSAVDKLPDNSTPNYAEFVCLDYPGCAMTGPVMGRIRGLPPLVGLILSANRRDAKGDDTSALETDRIKIEAAIDKKAFVLPRGYKMVPFRADMVESSATNDNTKSLLQDFMSK